MKEVKVAGARQLVEIHPDKTVFNINIEGTINSAGNDVMDLLTKAQGVMIDNNETLIVMGKTGVTVYIDGNLDKTQVDYLPTCILFFAKS